MGKNPKTQLYPNINHFDTASSVTICMNIILFSFKGTGYKKQKKKGPLQKYQVDRNE